MIYEVVKSNIEIDTWVVEAVGSEGEVYKVNFYGPDAESRANEYAEFKRLQKEIEN